MIPTCTGRGGPNPTRGLEQDHCCYISGVTCTHLVVTTDDQGEFYRCGVVLKYGSWSAANKSPEYATDIVTHIGKSIGHFWEDNGHGFNYCETFDPRQCCLKVVE